MPRFQYSLRGLFIVTTLLAVSFSLMRISFRYGELFGEILLVSTVGGSIGYLFRAAWGALIGVVVSWLLFALVVFYLLAFVVSDL